MTGKIWYGPVDKRYGTHNFCKEIPVLLWVQVPVMFLLFFVPEYSVVVVVVDILTLYICQYEVVNTILIHNSAFVCTCITLALFRSLECSMASCKSLGNPRKN